MADKGKTYIFILVLMILAALSLAGGMFYLAQQEKSKNVRLQTELDDLTGKFSVLKRGYFDYKRKFSEAKKVLVSFSRIKTKSDKEISNLNNVVQKQQDREQVLQAQLDVLKENLEKQKLANLDMEEKINRSDTVLSKLKKQLDGALAEKTALEKEMKNLQTQKQKVELGTIVVASDEKSDEKDTVKAAQPEDEKKRVATNFSFGRSRDKSSSEGAAGLEGKILVVNKEYNFAVLNVGSKDGVRVDDIFAVYHGNDFIGNLIVEKIHDSMSAAGFDSIQMVKIISEGDRVVHMKKN